MTRLTLPPNWGRAPSLLLAVGALIFLRAASCTQIPRSYKAPTSQEVLRAVQTRGQRVRTLRAETRMSQRTSQGKVKATVRLMAERPAKLRCDVVSPLDTPLATLVSDGTSFTLVDSEKNRHFHGPATPCNLARLLQVVLAPDDILTILGGSTPLITQDQATLRWDEHTGEEVLTLQGDRQSQTVRLDGDHRSWNLHLSEIKNQQGETILRIEMEDFSTLSGLQVPKTIKVEQPLLKTELTLTFKSQELNLSLPKAAFELLSANGLPSQRVECSTEVRP
jgi:outer membrane lipoprotein-sorting protein